MKQQFQSKTELKVQFKIAIRFFEIKTFNNKTKLNPCMRKILASNLN